MWQVVVVALLIAVGGGSAQAQTGRKKELITKLLQLQQTGRRERRARSSPARPRSRCCRQPARRFRACQRTSARGGKTKADAKPT